MALKTIDNINFRGKRVLLRSDLNSEVYRGKVVVGERISESAKTIKELQDKGARIVVIAHQGRQGEEDFISLKQHAKILRRYVKIKFVNDIIGKKAISEIKNLKNGEAILLENVRYLKEEFQPSTNNRMVNSLAMLFDIYVNDAFSVCHREQTSVVSFPKVLKSCMGRTMQKEVENLEKIKMKDCLFILGGQKAEENILLMKNKNVLTCGIFGQICLIASGINLGAQNKFLKSKLGIVNELKKCLGNAKMPVDLAVKVNGKRKNLKISEFPSKYNIYDIGTETQEEYAKMIASAKTIFMKGTAGYCEEKQFCEGTKSILKAIEKSHAFSVLSGGHTTTALKNMGINKKKIGYISLSGGATIEYIVGKRLPGLEVLKN